MKKLLLCLTALTMTATVSVGAQTFSVEKNLTSDEYTAWGQAEGIEYRKTISIMITKDTAPDVPVYVSTVEADNDGIYSVNFYMPDDAEDGAYTVKTRSYDSANIGEDDLYFSKTTTKSEILPILNSKTTESEFVSYLSEKALDFGLRNRETVKLTQAQLNNVYAKVYSQKPSDGYTLDGLYEAYYTNMTVAAVNAADETNIEGLIEDYSEYFDFDSQTCYSLFSELSDKSYAYKKFLNKNYADMNAVRTGFNQNTLLAAIKLVASPGEVTQLISDYESVITFDLSYYYASNASKQATALAGKDFADMDALEAAILAEYKAENPSTTTKPSPGGSGSLGGSSGVSIIGKVDIDTPLNPPVDSITGFIDISNDFWAANAIKYLSDKDIVSGYPDGSFNPNGKITREEFIVMLCRTFGFENNIKAEFADVDTTHWASEYIGTAAQKGIVNGMGDGNFGLGKNITREDMAVMINNAIKVTSTNISEKNDAADFDDAAEIADYAKESISVLQTAGIVNGMGDGRFNPKGNTTRAEASQIIYNVMNEGGM